MYNGGGGNWDKTNSGGNWRGGNNWGSGQWGSSSWKKENLSQSQEQEKQQPLCGEFEKGRCRRGRRCKWFHAVNGDNVAAVGAWRDRSEGAEGRSEVIAEEKLVEFDRLHDYDAFEDDRSTMAATPDKDARIMLNLFEVLNIPTYISCSFRIG